MKDPAKVPSREVTPIPREVGEGAPFPAGAPAVSSFNPFNLCQSRWEKAWPRGFTAHSCDERRSHSPPTPLAAFVHDQNRRLSQAISNQDSCTAKGHRARPQGAVAPGSLNSDRCPDSHLLPTPADGVTGPDARFIKAFGGRWVASPSVTHPAPPMAM